MYANPASSKATGCRPVPNSRTQNTSRPEDSSITPTPDEHGSEFKNDEGSGIKNDRAFALAAASLRQALQGPAGTDRSLKHIMIEESKEGLNINIVDQDGRSMFPEGSKEPYERTRELIQKIAGPLKATPYPDFHHRPHRRFADAAAPGLWAVEPFGRSGQYRAPDLEEEELSFGQHLQGGRQSRYRSAFPRTTGPLRQIAA